MRLPGDESSFGEVNDALLEGGDLSASASDRLTVELSLRPGRNAVAARIGEHSAEAREHADAHLQRVDIPTWQGRVGRDVRTHECGDVRRRPEAAFCRTPEYREPIAWPQANRDAVSRCDVLRVERWLPAQPLIIAIEKCADGVQCESGFR